MENELSSADWYLKGHFKNDPCMPGTLMCEGCLQAMALFLAGMGYTLDKDGWRFEPVPGEAYSLRCRGQVTPSSRQLVYEVFVEELWDGPVPTIYADILGTADGLKIFHGRRMGVRLVPDWPLTSRPELLAAIDETHHQVATVDGFPFGYASLLACAWGRPSDAFGPTARVYDGTRHIARLPGPPYHFMSRVSQVDGELGSMRTGASIELEYDIPPDAWYFDENGRQVMPLCVVLEAALQPCGWLAVYIGGPGTTEQDLYFRNLDGTSTLRAELGPEAGTLRTRTTLESISQVSGIVLLSYKAECFVGDRLVYEIDTGFGFFGKEALAQQVGLPASEADRAWLDEPCDFALNLKARPPRYCDGTLRLPGPMLLMIDQVTGYWPKGGPAGLGRWRAEKAVAVGEWFFKAHFYRDPVQPGSLGLEAMIQLLQLHLLHCEAGADIPNPQFEPLELDRPLTWKYRGQVTPKDRTITVELNIVKQGRDERGAYAVAEAWLWADKLRIYYAENIGMRIVAGAAPTPLVAGRHTEETLDPAVDRWLQDHRPNYTLPTLPLMSIVDRLAAAGLAFVTEHYRSAAGAEAWIVEAVDHVKLQGWLTFAGPRRLRCEVTPIAVEAALTWVSNVALTVSLLVWRDAPSDDLSRFEPIATSTVRLARGYGDPPPSWHPPRDRCKASDPYQSGALFHGPAFHRLQELSVGASGSSAILDAAVGSVPHGALNQALLDGLVHGIPHDDLTRWSETVDAEDLAYPFQIRSARFYGPPPSRGSVRCETRFAGFVGSERFPVFRIQALTDERLWAAIELVEVLVPMGEHGRSREKRLTFLRDRQFLPGIGLSSFTEGQTRLAFQEVAQKDWLKGSVAHAYCATGDLTALTRTVAIKDHLAQLAAAHPSTIDVAADGQSGVAACLPLTRYPVQVATTDDGVLVSDAGAPWLDLTEIRDFGRRSIGLDSWIGERLSLALCRRFVRRVIVTDPDAFASHRQQGALYLGNHQVQVESMLFPMLAAGLSGRHVVTIAGMEHETGWVGRYGRFSYQYPQSRHRRVIIFFDREDRQSMFAIIEQLKDELAAGHSVFVHVEGQLGRACRRPVQQISSVFIDLALELGIPIIPVRFAGGLPVDASPRDLDFPIGYGRQDYTFGRPISAAELQPLPYADRRTRVIEGLNNLGPPLGEEQPQPADGAYGQRVRAWQERTH
ncbi:MAG: 3-hydroxyacyl-[acyl-carrier-protein] dehydratase FabA, partial [Deltaproteobacteria bacterium]